MGRTTGGGMAMAGGDRVDTTSATLVEERSARGSRARRRGDLYALVEVSGPKTGRDAVVGELLNTVRSTYSGWQGSLTAGLLEAVRRAHAWLSEENRNSMPGAHFSAGIVCIVLRDDDLFVAQAGPAVAYVVQGGAVTRYPETSPWLDEIPPEEIEAVPLGGRREPEVALFHSRVGSGDLCLLVESSLAQLLSSRSVSSLLVQTPPDELVARLQATVGSGITSLMVQVGEGLPSHEAKGRAVQARTSLGPEATVQGESLDRKPLPGRWASFKDWLPKADWLRRIGQGLATTLAGLGVGLLTLLRRILPGRVQLAPSQSARPTRGASRAASRRRPVDPEERRGNPQVMRKLFIGLAVVLPLIVAVIVISTVIQRGQEQRAELEALWESARGHWQGAEVAADRLAIRTYLRSAEDDLDELIRRQPEDAEAIALRKQVLARLDELDQVRRITWVQELATYPADARLTRVVVEGTHVFVLDRNAGKVYHHEMDRLRQALEPATRDSVLVQRGDQVGRVLVGDPVDMVWVPVGGGRQRASLVILESGGNLLDYEPMTEQLTLLQVSNAVTWASPKLVGSYFGRFYVLDPTANKIWRYQPTANGYADRPDDWLRTQVDLIGVVDMAIGDSIYLLYAEGTIRRLTTGEVDRFVVSDWDSPPSNPGALFTQPPDEVRSVYLADRGNRRIVQVGIDGVFQRQFKLGDSLGGTDALSAVTSLFVKEISGHAFFLSGNKLYMVILPE